MGGGLYGKQEVRWTSQHRDGKLQQQQQQQQVQQHHQVQQQQQQRHQVQQITFRHNAGGGGGGGHVRIVNLDNNKLEPQTVYHQRWSVQVQPQQQVLRRDRKSDAENRYQVPAEKRAEPEPKKPPKVTWTNLKQRFAFVQRLYYDGMLHREYDSDEIEELQRKTANKYNKRNK